jgi:alanine racemase
MSYLSEDDIMVAIVPVGYSSGYSRDLSNLGKVIINGKRLDIIGTINMNLLTVDITNLDNPKIGQKVILIGKEDDVEVSVASFGEYTNQLNYEVLTQLDKEIERKFI